MKIEKLMKAFSQINKDLGSIFKTLLPGAYAKLEPSSQNSLLEGVEFKVAFGDVWKESLTELSGGQRSLVALSLILALLRYKPAPLYILDEVDAALDSSHTQNIGLMIKKHFQNSQVFFFNLKYKLILNTLFFKFVIVSLKDGMYSNANVLYKTKLEDGVSRVFRHTPKSQPNKEN
jgi:structural maintenance of chromosome 2